MNAADNQTQNLNYNPRNPNLTNPGLNKFARDYDKEPIIVKNYEDFFVETLFFMPLAFSIIVTIFIVGWVEDKSIDNILSLVIALACIACWMIINYFFYVIKKKDTVHFMNDSVKFYENGILKHASSLNNLDELICKPLDASMPNKGVRDIVLYIIVLCGCDFYVSWEYNHKNIFSADNAREFKRFYAVSSYYHRRAALSKCQIRYVLSRALQKIFYNFYF